MVNKFSRYNGLWENLTVTNIILLCFIDKKFHEYYFFHNNHDQNLI